MIKYNLKSKPDRLPYVVQLESRPLSPMKSRIVLALAAVPMWVMFTLAISAGVQMSQGKDLDSMRLFHGPDALIAAVIVFILVLLAHRGDVRKFKEFENQVKPSFDRAFVLYDDRFEILEFLLLDPMDTSVWSTPITRAEVENAKTVSVFYKDISILRIPEVDESSQFYLEAVCRKAIYRIPIRQFQNSLSAVLSVFANNKILVENESSFIKQID